MFMQQRSANRSGGDKTVATKRRRSAAAECSAAAQPGRTALQTALNNNAPDGQIKDLLDRIHASQKAKQDKLKAGPGQPARGVVPVKQEAQATLLGLLN